MSIFDQLYPPDLMGFSQGAAARGLTAVGYDILLGARAHLILKRCPEGRWETDGDRLAHELLSFLCMPNGSGRLT